LLVVVAIIALLLAILLPALGKAKALARNVKCLSNLRAVNLSISFYAGDNSGYVIPAGIANDATYGVYVPDGYPAWMGVGPHHPIMLGQYTDVDDRENPWGTIRNDSLWRCPEDEIASTDRSVSYSMISRTSGSGAGQFFPSIRENFWSEDRWKTLPKMSAVDAPSLLMTFADKDVGSSFAFEGAWPTQTNMGVVRLYGNIANTGTPAAFSKNVPESNWNHRMWHPPATRDAAATGTNMGFIDGHAATIVNDPSDVDGQYWLSEKYGVDFVFRPQDYN
jgi:prepilin-type processing-associated H-X9-DG protein